MKVRGTRAWSGTTDITSCGFSSCRICMGQGRADWSIHYLSHDEGVKRAKPHIVLLHDPRSVVEPVGVF